MLRKTMKKITCGILAFSATLACASFSACETSKPKVEMEIEFNGETYTLEYILYRKVAPATVNHFLALVENGYYNGLCVHDYTDDKMYIGSYSYADDNLVYKKYYDVVKGYQNFPNSVWTDSSQSETTYTLYGEFYNNGGFLVENGAIAQSFGSLTMYYSDKAVDQEDKIAINRHDGGGMATRQYKYNSATSQFFISVDTETNKDNNYCTFATIDEDSASVLTELQVDILTYVSDTYGDEGMSDFALETETYIDADDRFVGERENVVTYHVPQKPIIIKNMKVTKY